MSNTIMPICEQCGTYFTRLPCPICGAGDQITSKSDLLVQEYMELTAEEDIAAEQVRRVLFFGKIAEEAFKLEFTIKARTDFELVLDESTLFGKRFGRKPDTDQDYINTVEIVIRQLQVQVEAKAVELDEALQDVLSLQTRIEELEEQNELLRQQAQDIEAKPGIMVRDGSVRPIVEVKGVGSMTRDLLREHGISTIKDFLRITDLNAFSEKTGINITRLERIRQNAERFA